MMSSLYNLLIGSDPNLRFRFNYSLFIIFLCLIRFFMSLMFIRELTTYDFIYIPIIFILVGMMNMFIIGRFGIRNPLVTFTIRLIILTVFVLYHLFLLRFDYISYIEYVKNEDEDVSDEVTITVKKTDITFVPPSGIVNMISSVKTYGKYGSSTLVTLIILISTILLTLFSDKSRNI